MNSENQAHSYLKYINQSGRLSNLKKIALIGLPLLDRTSHPQKKALSDCLEDYPNWEISVMCGSFVESFELLLKIPCDGVLARVVSEETAAIARRIPCPVVNISNLLEDTGLPSVCRNDRQIGAMCAQHLVDKRFSRIGIVRLNEPSPPWSSSEAQAGFLETIDIALPQVNLYHHLLDPDSTKLAIIEKLQAWLKTLFLPAALFLLDDRFAPEVMEACHNESLNVPRDIAIISSVGHPETLPFCRTSLTHPMPEGKWSVPPACEYLAKLMENPKEPVRKILVPCPKLVQGESTDIIAVEDSLVAKAVDYIHAKFNSGINVSDVVAHANCSRRGLESRFGKTMGQPIHKYLVDVRIRHALKLMKNAGEFEKLEGIAIRSGFGSYKPFRIAFHQFTGKTPSEWQLTRLKKDPSV